MRRQISQRRSPSRITTVVAVLALTVTGLAAATTSASAANDGRTVLIEIPAGATPFSYLVADRSGKPVRNPSVRTESISGKRYAVADVGIQVVFCVAWNSPAPTYSWSNHTMHFGTQAQCDAPIPVRVKSVLYSGPDTSHLYTWQADTGWNYGVTSAYAGSVRSCVDWGGFAWWEMLGYAQGDTDLNGVWENFVPYPGQSLKENECLDIV